MAVTIVLISSAVIAIVVYFEPVGPSKGTINDLVYKTSSFFYIVYSHVYIRMYMYMYIYIYTYLDTPY